MLSFSSLDMKSDIKLPHLLLWTIWITLKFCWCGSDCNSMALLGVNFANMMHCGIYIRTDSAQLHKSSANQAHCTLDCWRSGTDLHTDTTHTNTRATQVCQCNNMCVMCSGTLSLDSSGTCFLFWATRWRYLLFSAQPLLFLLHRWETDSRLQWTKPPEQNASKSTPYFT